MGTKALMKDHANTASLSEDDLLPQRKEKLKPGGTLIILPEAGSSKEFLPAIHGIVLFSNWRFNVISYVRTLHFRPNIITQPSAAALGFQVQ